MQKASQRYSSSVELYRTTSMSAKDICAKTGVSLDGFKTYMRRHHRDLMFARQGIEVSSDDAQTTKLRQKSGQTPATAAKYSKAIEACASEAFLEYNISQIAHQFNLSPTGLGNQLRNHFPEILAQREKARKELGFTQTEQPGPRNFANQQYAQAVEHLRLTDDTIEQTARIFDISYSGLRQHILFYHKELVELRAKKRAEAEGSTTTGALTGNGQKYLPKAANTQKYSDALNLYRTTTLTVEKIAEMTGVSYAGLRNYLSKWRRDLIDEAKDSRDVTADKYADALRLLKSEDCCVAEVAKSCDLEPDIFRQYLHKHEPQLAQSLGMSTLDNGKKTLNRTSNKYKEAIALYESTNDSLRSIALGLNLNYKSLSGYVRRNYPELIEKHKT